MYIIYGSVNVQLSAAVMVGLWPWEAGGEGEGLPLAEATLLKYNVMYYLSCGKPLFLPFYLSFFSSSSLPV